jgi:hypothetical protein
MGKYLDLDDVVHGHPVAERELAALRNNTEAVLAENDAIHDRAEKAERELDEARAMLREAVYADNKAGRFLSLMVREDFCQRVDALLARKEGP